MLNFSNFQNILRSAAADILYFFIFNFFFIKAPHYLVLEAKPDLIQELFGLTSRALIQYTYLYIQFLWELKC